MRGTCSNRFLCSPPSLHVKALKSKRGKYLSNSKKQSGFFLTILHALQCMKRADDDVISNNRHHQRFRLGDASGGSESLLTFFSMIAMSGQDIRRIADSLSQPGGDQSERIGDCLFSPFIHVTCMYTCVQQQRMRDMR